MLYQSHGNESFAMALASSSQKHAKPFGEAKAWKIKQITEIRTNTEKQIRQGLLALPLGITVSFLIFGRAHTGK